MKVVTLDQYEAPPPFCQIPWKGRQWELVIHFQDVVALPKGVHVRQATKPRDSYLLAYYTRGSGRVWLDGEQHAVGPQSLVLSHPHVMRQVLPTTDTPMRAVLLTFGFRDGDEQLTLPTRDLFELLAGERLLEVAPVISLSREQHLVISERLDAVIRACSMVGLPWFPANRAFLELLLAVIGEVLLPKPEQRVASLMMERVRREIERHFCERLPLASLARFAGLSPNYLCARFKTTYGQTPREYQLQLQLRMAQHLLTRQDQSVAEIAEACGFASRHLFSRQFKKRIGMTPNAFRRHQPLSG